MTGAQFIARVYQILGLPATHPEVTSGVIADAFVARGDELTLLVKPPTLRKTVYRNVVANSATVYLPTDHLQTIKIRQQDANGRWLDLCSQTQEDNDGQADPSVNADSLPSGTYSYAGIVATPGANSYGQRILRLNSTPTTSTNSGLEIRYWVQTVDLITGTNSQYQIVQVPKGYHLGYAHGVAGLIAIDPRINRDPIPYLQVWQDMVQRYQHTGAEHREYDYHATGYSSIAQSQAAHWMGQ